MGQGQSDCHALYWQHGSQVMHSFTISYWICTLDSGNLSFKSKQNVFSFYENKFWDVIMKRFRTFRAISWVLCPPRQSMMPTKVGAGLEYPPLFHWLLTCSPDNAHLHFQFQLILQADFCAESENKGRLQPATCFCPGFKVFSLFPLLFWNKVTLKRSGNPRSGNSNCFAKRDGKNKLAFLRWLKPKVHGRPKSKAMSCFKVWEASSGPHNLLCFAILQGKTWRFLEETV